LHFGFQKLKMQILLLGTRSFPFAARPYRTCDKRAESVSVGGAAEIARAGRRIGEDLVDGAFDFRASRLEMRQATLLA
jgi:hypothetical protein